jgi:hypothetical protein
MVDKKTHFGRAGEYFAMSELLLRGWNVAVPVVDVGDDAFVIDDRDKTTRRVQVKTAAAEQAARGGTRPTCVRAVFNLSREQLRTAQPIELFYMLMVRYPTHWRALIIPRLDLLRFRSAYLAKGGTGAGRRPVADGDATTDGLTLVVEIEDDKAVAWGAALDPYLDRWPDDFRIVEGGPGSVASGPAPDATQPSSGDPSR